MSKIRIAIAGVGNCASALVQGIHYYTPERCGEGVNGLMHVEMGGYHPSDIEVVSAFDIDARKVGKDVHEAIFAPPNCTTIFHATLPPYGVNVRMGKILDGVSEHMSHYDDKRTFVVADVAEPTKADIVQELKRSEAEVLVNYMPVGSEEAANFYAECALEAGLAFINTCLLYTSDAADE